MDVHSGPAVQAATRNGRPRAALTRRALLFDLGAAVAVIAVGGCTSDGSPEAETSSPGAGADGTSTGAAAATEPVDPGTDAGAGSGTGLQWRRAVGGVASAYVLVRAGEATVVDTGQSGSAPAIEMALAELGMAWADVASVVLTHRHPDHVGSLDVVAERAADATLFGGHGDLDAMPRTRDILGVGMGDTVMDMEVIDTPGHTPGHISVFDALSGVLVAGDALNGTEQGGVTGPNEAFSDDMDLARASAVALADLRPDVILFGHGPPAQDAPADELETLVAPWAG
jgi:glyoxylase-like metal-dependent hydrolase (beta-lactamase superfamily II)